MRVNEVFSQHPPDCNIDVWIPADTPQIQIILPERLSNSMLGFVVTIEENDEAQ